jgi:hypothetical protein
MAGEVGCSIEMAVAITKIGVKNFLPKKNAKITSLD